MKFYLYGAFTATIFWFAWDVIKFFYMRAKQRHMLHGACALCAQPATVVMRFNGGGWFAACNDHDAQELKDAAQGMRS